MWQACIACTILLAGAWNAGAGEPPTTPLTGLIPGADDPLGEPITKLVFLDQNWSSQQRNQFYSTPQGSEIIPYEWYLALERADSDTLFNDIKTILKYRFLPQAPSPTNRDGLPVGFVADQGAGRRWLGMTCAACHTTDIRLGTTAYRVDGGPTQSDVPGFLGAMTYSLRRTLEDPAKFDRFAKAILKEFNTPSNQADLRTQLTASIQFREGYNLRNFQGYQAGQPNPTPTNYGRLDAVDAIVNEIYHAALPASKRTDPVANAKTPNAPVSYPCLWDTPQHDLVEWLGIAKSGGPLDVLALSRNVGEVLGVFGNFAIPEDPSFFKLGYPSSVKVVNLRSLEDLLKGLWSPQWPDDFPKVDTQAAVLGQTIYKSRCTLCHEELNRKDPNRTVTAVMNACGTDPQASKNFFGRIGPSGLLAGATISFVPFTAKMPAMATADQMITHVVAGVILGQAQGEPDDGLHDATFRGRHATLASAAPGAEYKARSLNGIWATAPYLHNGSVPTLDALLRPLKDRPTSFPVGTRTFDPVKVGYISNAPGFPLYQVNDSSGTPIVGNSNDGHFFGSNLTDPERYQLIEYLKTL